MAVWLDLEHATGGWTVVESDRMSHILDLIDCPSARTPVIQLFIGQRAKLQALRSLHPYNNVGRSGRQGFARLYLAGESQPDPVLFIETGHSAHREGRWEGLSQPVRRHRLPDTHDQTSDDIRDLVHQRLCLPVADTVCLFAADLGGIAQVQACLARWRAAPPVNLDGSTSPRRGLLVVLTDPQELDGGEALASALVALAVPRLAASVSVVDLRDRQQLSPVSRFEPLRQRLRDQLEEAQAARADAHLAFSTVHWEWIFRKALQQMTQRPTAPFDCIRASRPRRSTDSDRTRFMQDFLTVAAATSLPPTRVAPFVASALLMDAYPPGMHGFCPETMFRRLYRASCRAACSAVWPVTTDRLIQSVEGAFASLFTVLASNRSSAQARRAFLQREPWVWGPLKSSRVCLFCLQRPPEHLLPCGHALCDTCVAIVGIRGGPAEYHFEIPECPLCLQGSSIVIRQLPPTKRPTILVLDGGGVRGVVTLGFLRALEDEVGGGRGLRDAVDLTVGTSAGAVIASEIIVRGTSAREADTKFRALARRIFPKRSRLQTLWGQSWGLFTSWIADSRYNSQVLEETLQAAYGSVRRLFDVTAPLVSGSRVALTASRVDDGALGVLANYRGVGRHRIQSAHQALVSDEEPLLWEAARCSVAALGYFTPKTLRGIGTLQDGGVRANCPLRAALRESQIIWPSCPRPDLVVSIGTGHALDDTAAPTASTEKGNRLFGGSFIARGIRTFLSSPAVDGWRGWQDARDSIPEDVVPHVFRLDRPVRGALPELDDVHALDDLGEFDYRIPDELTQAWLTRSFFFEMDEKPIPARGWYECHGSILCCRAGVAGLLCQVQRQWPGARFTVFRGSDLGPVDNTDGCDRCGYYRHRVAFSVSSLQEALHLGISGGIGFSPLGGFPTTVQQLLEDQQADCPFGRADHRRNSWPLSRSCYCTGRKRAPESASSERAYKRRRRL